MNVNDATFEAEVIRSPMPVLVDFAATWCGPCRALSPIVDEIAREYMGRIKVVQLDIDTAPLTANRFSIRGVPTLIAFHGGREISRVTGLVPKQRIVALFGSTLP